MTREIKFRGKRKDTGEWVYGYYVCYGGAIPSPTHHIIHAKDNLNRLVGENFEVDPATVGQYTGLKDKNGKEIYEGDITKDPDGNVFEVVWNKGATSFELQNKISHFLFVQRYIDMFEVIGNIHDNPELMEAMP